MKRVFLLVLTAAMVLCLFGCGKAELPKEAKLGETLKTDLVEVTLTDFGFAEEGVSIDEEKPDVFCKPIPFPYALTGNESMDNFTLRASQSTYVRATEEKCVVYLEYTVKITADETVTQAVGMPQIHFNDAEHYTLNATFGAQLSDDFNDLDALFGAQPSGRFNKQYDGVYYSSSSGDSWSSMNMFWAPDTEYLCRGVAKIPVEVESNTDAPLTVSFSLPNSDGSNETYTFTIR